MRPDDRAEGGRRGVEAPFRWAVAITFALDVEAPSEVDAFEVAKERVRAGEGTVVRGLADRLP